jgi:predicted flap endonuclease-1-like 5' DNA nuclease
MRGAAGMAAGAAVYDADEGSDMAVVDAGELDAADVAAEPTADELRSELEAYIRSLGTAGSEFRKDVEYVEGIGAVYGQKLRAVGIGTVLDLLVNGATRRGRKQIADQAGLQQSQILTWVNHVDLFRIKGVAQEYADLLEQSGVDTVVELAQRNPANLHKRMVDINTEKSLVRRPPHASEVQSWVEQAKSLRRLIHY